MLLKFYKYHGAGNDFIMIDCRNSDESFFSNERVKFLCDRHFGIGADGLILLLKDNTDEFRMKYFNSDGMEGTMCGNGGRCITTFAHDLGIIKKSTVFTGIDGSHRAEIIRPGLISLKMTDVKGVKEFPDGYLVDTGSPHFVTFRKSVSDIDVYSEGRNLRHQQRFANAGVNINFVEDVSQNVCRMRTFERGVENETLACGTGAVAAAISSYCRQKTDKNSYSIEVPGGTLTVRFNPHDNMSFTDVWLEGPVKFVFKGEISLD
jgi:diaminopimelate epimerase